MKRSMRKNQAKKKAGQNNCFPHYLGGKEKGLQSDNYELRAYLLKAGLMIYLSVSKPMLFSQSAISFFVALAGNLRLSSQVTVSGTSGYRFFALDPRPLDAEVQKVTKVFPLKS